jgi:prepilin-type N-terminal cleavage/methylation domain-containing protein
MRRIRHRSERAFTLMELMTVMVIMSILMVLLLKATDSMRARAEKANCISNLKSLYTGAAAYVMDKGEWPQVPARLVRTNSKEYAKLWINSLAPYGISQRNWICPTKQRNMGAPDLTKDENRRIDYNATPFDSRPHTAYLWPRQPWFVEHAASHDGGPLLIMTNGRVMTMREAIGPKLH